MNVCITINGFPEWGYGAIAFVAVIAVFYIAALWTRKGSEHPERHYTGVVWPDASKSAKTKRLRRG